MQPILNIVQLRQLLAERLPGLRQFSSEPKSTPGWPSGVTGLDTLLHGGLPKSAITELISGHPGAGSASLVTLLLRHVYQTSQWLGLIDGQDSFDPAPLENAVLNRLLWVRCRETRQALQAADLLLRDGNLPLILLDLRLSPSRELRRIPATTWYRFQRILELTSIALLVVTPWPLVSSAEVQLTLESRFTLDALGQTEAALLPQLQFRLVRSWQAAAESRELIAQTG